jgi:hypothetical protein
MPSGLFLIGRSFQVLMQRVSVAVQRGNAASIAGTVPSAVDRDIQVCSECCTNHFYLFTFINFRINDFFKCDL